MSGRHTERLELERAGWERLEHEGETVWRNPVSGLVYPQGKQSRCYAKGRTRKYLLARKEGRDETLARVVQAPGKMAVPFLDSY